MKISKISKFIPKRLCETHNDNLRKLTFMSDFRLHENQIPNGSDSVLDGLDDVAPPRAARAVAVVVLAAAALAVAHEDAGHVTHGAAAHVAPGEFDPFINNLQLYPNYDFFAQFCSRKQKLCI